MMRNYIAMTLFMAGFYFGVEGFVDFTTSAVNGPLYIPYFEVVASVLCHVVGFWLSRGKWLDIER